MFNFIIVIQIWLFIEQYNNSCKKKQFRGNIWLLHHKYAFLSMEHMHNKLFNYLILKYLNTWLIID